MTEWPRVLKLSGLRRAGKTTALIAIANAARDHGTVVYVVPGQHAGHMAHGLRAASLHPEIAVVTGLNYGPRPVTVVVDHAYPQTDAERRLLIEDCRVLGAPFLITSEIEG